MKILFACHGAGNGGAERVITTLANEFYKRQYSVVLITTKEKYNDYQLENGIKHIRIVVDCKSKVLATISRLRQIRKCVKKERPDCIISFSAITNLRIIISTLFLNIKTIVSERVDPSKHPTSRIRRILRILLYPFANRIVFQTEEAMNYFPNGIKKKGIVIPNPIRRDLPSPFIGSRKKVIVGVGSLGEQKNWRMALSACKLFFKHEPDYKFIIYGEGPLREQLQHQINKDRELKDKVFLAGFDNDVVEKIKNAKMYISTSNYEGISNSMLEALAVGVPTICTDCPAGGAKSVITPNYNGFLVKVGDYKEFSEKMILLASDEKLCSKFSNNSVQIRKKLRLDSIVDLWENEILK